MGGLYIEVGVMSSIGFRAVIIDVTVPSNL